MVYSEIKNRNNKRYYYRIRSIREGKKVRKERIYLGVNLSKKELKEKEIEADKKIIKNKIDENLKYIKPKIISVFKKNKIKRAGIFGSYANGKQRKNSDIDILVEVPKNMGFKFANLSMELEKVLKIKVDIISYNGISPYLRNEILKQEIRLI